MSTSTDPDAEGTSVSLPRFEVTSAVAALTPEMVREALEA